MPETIRRGYVPEDEREFNEKAVLRLREALADLVYLLERGYKLEHAVSFIGDRFQFSARQRMALTRAAATRAAAESRRKRERRPPAGCTLYIDGFNLIITLETALSHTTLLSCMDGALRDLCGLHGTYRLIDKTFSAVKLTADMLERLQIGESVFYLDAPVSNSGRLAQEILNGMEGRPFAVKKELVPNADACLWGRDGVVTSDAGILDRCGWWTNLAALIVENMLPDTPTVNFCCPA